MHANLHPSQVALLLALALLIVTLVGAVPMSHAVAAEPHASAHLPAELQPGPVANALARHLEQEVLPFWTAPGIVDPEHGGYLVWFDADGRPTQPDAPKALITHLRLLFVHAVAIRRASDDATRQRLRRQYEQGLDFLERHFRHPEGGWYTEVQRDGTVQDASRQTLGQVYVVYVLSDCYRLLSDSRARRLALETFAWLDAHGHDATHGGYLERCDRAPDAPENATKAIGTNLHAALALARLFQVAPTKLLRERLEELYARLTRQAIHRVSRNAYVTVRRDWQPGPPAGDPQQQTLFGHNAELAWYLQDVARVLGKDPRSFLPWLRRAGDAFLKLGLTPEGCVRVWGPIRGRPNDPDGPSWWTQAEGMLLCARLYAATREERYWEAFARVCRYTFRHLVVDHSGAWLGGVNLKTGERSPRGGAGWKAGHHVVRALLECEQALRESERPPLAFHSPRVKPRRAVQVDPGFAYYQGRSAASIVAELKANGFDCLHLICLSDEVAVPGLVEEARRQGIEVWGTFFPTGVYMPDRLFPPEHEEWRLQLSGPQYDGYRFFSYIHRGYQQWWKQHLARLFRKYPFDGMLFYEVHYPTMNGPTLFSGKPCFSDVSPGFVRAFQQATGHAAFPNFTNPEDPHYYERDRRLYEDFVEFRIQSIIDFQREVLDGEGGFRRQFPHVPFATWTIALAHPEGPAAMRENESQDPARLVVELRPDAHFLQSHAPDWYRHDQPPTYVEGYAPYAQAVQDAAPGLPMGVQADVCSTCDYHRDPAWMRAMEATSHRLGLRTTTYYEFCLRWEVYFEPPVVKASRLDPDGRATLVFDQRLNPRSCAFLEGHPLPAGRKLGDVQVDGNLLHFRVVSALKPGARVSIPLAGITDDPSVRFPMPTKGQGNPNAISPGTTVTLTVRRR